MIKEKNQEKEEWQVTISFQEVKKIKRALTVIVVLVTVIVGAAIFSLYYLKSVEQENALYRNQLKMADEKLKEIEEKTANIESLGKELQDFIKSSGECSTAGGKGGAATVPDKAAVIKIDKPKTPGALLMRIHQLDERLNESMRNYISLRSFLMHDTGTDYTLMGEVKSHVPDAWPVVGSISSYYGYRNSPGGIGSTFHEGVDITGEYGTPIQVTADGVVTKAGWAEGYGYLVEVNHGNGYSTRYAHNSIVFVKEGQEIRKGTIIALMGSTGNSTGTHCHYEVRINGDSVNPIYFLPGAVEIEK